METGDGYGKKTAKAEVCQWRRPYETLMFMRM